MTESRVKVLVDHARCQGHTLCAMVAPDWFELDDEDGHASVRREEVPSAQLGVVEDAARSCPEQAILITGGGE